MKVRNTRIETGQKALLRRVDIEKEKKADEGMRRRQRDEKKRTQRREKAKRAKISKGMMVTAWTKGGWFVGAIWARE